MSTCRQEYKEKIEPWFLQQFVQSPTFPNEKEMDNFGFENPNYNNQSSSTSAAAASANHPNQYRSKHPPHHPTDSSSIASGGGGGGEEELNNSLDLYYERNDTVWTSPPTDALDRLSISDGGNIPSDEPERDYENYSSIVDEKSNLLLSTSTSSKNGNATRSIKRRTEYARLGMGDMGIPNSPSIEFENDRALASNHQRKPFSTNHPSESDTEVLEEIRDVWYKHSTTKTTKNSRHNNDDEHDGENYSLSSTNDESNNRSPNNNPNFGGRGGGGKIFQKNYASNNINNNNNSNLLKIITSSKSSTSKNLLRQYKSLDNLSIDVDQDKGTTTANMYTNGNGHYQRQHQYADDAAVDYSPHDFRRSFAAIDQASRERPPSAPFYPGGGLRMRKETDDGTTVVTEHRDPYSFYWQLDKARQREEEPLPREMENVIEEIAVEESTQVQSPDSHDSGIHVEYTRPSKPVKPIIERFAQSQPQESPKRKLPPGWEKHEDPSGYSYYWHVDSGTVQREPPKEAPKMRVQRAVVDEEPPLPEPKVMSLLRIHKPEEQRALMKTHRSMADQRVHVQQKPSVSLAQTPVQVVQAPIVHQAPPQQPIIIERAFKQTTTKRRIENDTMDDREETGEDGGPKTPIRFAVRSLGWTEIAEEDLTPERSSRAVNKAIVDLSMGRNDLIDNVSKWGDGKELIMELDDHDLRLIDPDAGVPLHSQPIHQIRVWGVGRDNGRDFAYVARDRASRRFMCHVFRCDTPARTIANTLRDICKRLMMERRPTSLTTSNSNSTNLSNGRDSRQSQQQQQHHQQQQLSRPSSRYGLEQIDNSRRSVSRDPFPTPMEEPKKVIRCHFLGVTQVPRATGIEILNEAVDRLVSQVRTERWILVDVSIAPSTITITEVGGNQIAECRVRYLSFLGIGRDVKHCAFIMHTSADNYMCYVFHVEPSAGAMAKTIEAACKLRYQKVLDSHTERRANGSKGFSDTIRNVFGSIGSIAGRKTSPRTSQQYPT